MYKYLHYVNSETKIDDKLSQAIENNLKKNRIHSKIIEFNSEKELASILSSLKISTTNTLVLIGDDKDFNNLIGQIGKLSEEIAIGYLPVNKSGLAKKLKINSWQSAIEALAQRRIKEKTLYSVSSRYFFDEIQLDFNKNEIDNKITIQADKSLELTIPNCSLKIENLSEDQYFSKTPIQLVAYRSNENSDKPIKQGLFSKITKKIIKNNTEKDSQEPVLSLHSKNFKVKSPTNGLDNLQRKYSLSFSIGKSSRNIRLITKRPGI